MQDTKKPKKTTRPVHIRLSIHTRLKKAAKPRGMNLQGITEKALEFGMTALDIP